MPLFKSNPSPIIILFLFFISCSSANRLIIDPNYSPSIVSIEQVLATIPDYSLSLVSAKGNGRAIISETGNSDRVTIDFETNSELSLINFKNRIGIQGGAMLVDQDSITMYYKIDKIAQKVALSDGRLTSLNELASVNLLDLLNFKIGNEQISNVFESETHYMLVFKNRGSAIVDIKTGLIDQVLQPPSTRLPYSSITYENYSVLEDYTLPRKITIFSADANSKVILQIRELEINPSSLNLTIDIPSNITIQRI